MSFFGKKYDKDALTKAIEFLEAPHEVSWDLSDVPDYVMKPLGFFESDYEYLKHYDKLQEKGITADKMSKSNIVTMFTFFNRGERFSTGFTAEIINNGELLAVYKRLSELI